MITEPHARLQHQESNAISSYKRTKSRTKKISALAIQTKHYSQLRNPCRIKLNFKAKQEGRGGGHPTPLQKATEAGDDDCLKTNLE
jgi:hypothetical protein